jgi:hypothetical protein
MSSPAMERGAQTGATLLVGIPVDYRDNHQLLEIIHPGSFN